MWREVYLQVFVGVADVENSRAQGENDRMAALKMKCCSKIVLCFIDIGESSHDALVYNR